MQIYARSTLHPYYSGFDMKVESNKDAIIAANKLTTVAQLGMSTKGAVHVKSCVFNALDENPAGLDMKLSDLIQEHPFEAEIKKNEDGMLVLHATLPEVGKYLRLASCNYSVSDDLELTTSDESTIEVNDGEGKVEVEQYRSTKSTDLHFDNPVISFPNGSVFHAKAHNIKEGYKFVGVDYLPFVLPTHIPATAGASIAEFMPCALSITTVNGEQRSVVKSTIEVDVFGNVIEGISVYWSYDLPSPGEGRIADVDIHCPDLKMMSHSQVSAQKARFKIVGATSDLSVANEDVLGVVTFSGVSAASLFIAAGIIASSLALLF